ncbi:hypothetical protein EPUS_06724 [Endocarpon pusillum Z07020]|uniref:GRAM domain-containing protein n=1 Tax=Endocarpon pusillum (strain Z07020 / HMAS-L-300199) TaxID=1263415 RepID=U1HPF2_ENDPU|nr:uncharacterized protein EPUS_06724 [Endocarpon pusillum Z07020]ERF70939.1 hypothetical protein EPUS_06724 [Endocarpon pusillum Z07020]
MDSREYSASLKRGSSIPVPREVDGGTDERAEPRLDKSAHNDHLGEPLTKRDKARGFVRKAREKAIDLVTPNNKDTLDPKDDRAEDAIDQIACDPAFNPSLVLDQSPPKLTKADRSTVKSELKSVAQSLVHPRQTIQGKATRSAAAKISRAQRPFLSAEQDRNLLAAHDELDRLASSRSSTRAQTSAESGAESSGEEKGAKQKVEKLEEQRSSLQVAWTLGRHVDRVKVVQARVPESRSWDNFVEKTPSGERGRFQWERWLGYQALYYTRGFTARYIDDFDELPFDMEDLSRIVERLVLVSTPWQAWLMSIRQIYTWEDPKRTGRWFALFCCLWYTQHIMGFVFADIIYTVLKNKFHPSSVESVRESMKRGIDREARAQAWGELVEQHGRKDWIEPLLDELGPYIQLQLGDLTDLLEVLANFYRWRTPWKTAETLFFFGCCLLITLLTDMAFCMKVFWFIVGGWFFLCFPIASRYPKYRYLVDPAKWMFWDIPTDAEWSIELLQRKTSFQQRRIDRRQQNNDHGNPADSDSETSNSEYEEDPTLPRHSTPGLEAPPYNTETFKFRAYQRNTRGHLLLTRSGIRFSSRCRSHSWSIPYRHLTEMRKAKPDATIKATTLGTARAGLQFLTTTTGEGSQTNEPITITVPRDRRDEIFNLVLGWSGLTWRSVCMERRRAEKTAGGKMKELRALLV